MSAAPLQPDYEAAWDFLQRFHPGRPIVVSGITLDKKSIPTDTFNPNERTRFLKWVAACAAMPANIYFSVGEPLASVTKKMERAEIKAVHYLHVDVDPRAGESLAQEQERILNLLRNPPAPLPPPTIIVYSGGGYQGYWKLSEPLPVDGVEAVAEDIKLYNVQLERVLGGDNCHDISRIMRVPWTVNEPDAKKIKKGRVAALAEVIEWHDDRVYDIARFTKAVVVQSGIASGCGIGDAPKIKAPGNVRTFTHVDEIGERVSDEVKVFIVNGENPNAPGHFPSRSEGLFWVVCELVRAGVDDETIYAVLMNRDWRISDSVLEKGRDAERYALRQIERAKEDATDPMLREFNDKHAVIGSQGGKCFIIEEQFDPMLERARLVKQGFDHFRNRYMNRTVDLGEKKDKKGNVIGRIEMSAAEWWLRHEDRRQYETIVFAPGRDVPGSYNLWRGFGCDAKPGDCGLFLDHIRDIVCGGVEAYYRFYVGWMADCVQNPGRPAESNILMYGKQGCGKTIVPYFFGKVFGRHYMMVNSSGLVTGRFNAHLRDVVLLFADEAFFAGNKQDSDILKTIITSKELVVEEKGHTPEVHPNFLHLMMATNKEWAINAEFGDRRNFVLNVLPDKIGNRDYFDAIVAQMESGGCEALLHHLLTYDLKAAKWDRRDVPKTDALRDQQDQSMPWDVEAVIYMATYGLSQDARVDRAWNMGRPDEFHPESGKDRIGQWEYLRNVLQLKSEGRKVSSYKFAEAMRKWGFARVEDIRNEGGVVWKAPPLPELRRKIDEHTGKVREWPGGADASWGWAESSGIPDYYTADRDAARQQVEEAKALRDSVGAEVFDRILRAGIALGKAGGNEVPF